MDAPPPAPGSPSRTLTGRLKLGDWPEQLAPALTCHLRGTRFESFEETGPYVTGDVVDVRIATTRLERTLMRSDVCLQLAGAEKS